MTDDTNITLQTVSQLLAGKFDDLNEQLLGLASHTDDPQCSLVSTELAVALEHLTETLSEASSDEDVEAIMSDLADALNDIEAPAVETLPEDERATIHFDGACRDNPGPAAVGAVIKDSDGTIIDTVSRKLPHGPYTNNQAEYLALHEALTCAALAGVNHATVRGDSELIIKQMTGEYDCNDDELADLLDTAQQKAGLLDSVEYEHVDRSENSKADDLANEAFATA